MFLKTWRWQRFDFNIGDGGQNKFDSKYCGGEMIPLLPQQNYWKGGAT